jgi:hypothetical protein
MAAASCVPYQDLAERMKDQHLAYNLVLSSGASGCDGADGQPVGIRGKIVVLLLPGAGGSVSEHLRFAAREARLTKVFPAVEILRPYAIGMIPQALGAAPEESRPTSPVAVRNVAPIRRAAFVQSAGDGPASKASQPVGRRDVRLPESLKKILERAQRDNVRLSWGPEQGQCYTCQNLQEDLAVNKPETVANGLRQNREFIAIALALKEMPEEERTALTDGCRVALHKTWTEIGKVGPEGQTDCGKQMELLIVNKCIDALFDLVDKSAIELQKAMAAAH